MKKDISNINTLRKENKKKRQESKKEKQKQKTKKIFRKTLDKIKKKSIMYSVIRQGKEHGTMFFTSYYSYFITAMDCCTALDISCSDIKG